MLLDTIPERRSDPLQAVFALAAQPMGARRPVQGWREAQAAGVYGVGEKPGTDWVKQMLAVRDHGDRAAFAELFRHFAPRVKAFLVKGGMTPAAAEDCAQDVLAVLWQKAHLFDPARASVATWVFAIARNRRIDLARRNRRPEPEALPWGPEDEPDQAELYEAAQETRRLGEALALLPEPQRALIQRAFYGDLTHSQIAAETGLPLGTIKSRIRLALERLRAKMSETSR